VTSDDVRVPDGDALGVPPLSDALTPVLPHPVADLTQSGSPTGLARWGGALAVRSFLQNFRC
jgi:hypothetical protein